MPSVCLRTCRFQLKSNSDFAVADWSASSNSSHALLNTFLTKGKLKRPGRGEGEGSDVNVGVAYVTVIMPSFALIFSLSLQLTADYPTCIGLCLQWAVPSPYLKHDICDIIQQCFPLGRRELSGRPCTSRHANVERLWVRIPQSSPAEPSCHRCGPTCLKTESNLAPHMAASPLRHVISQCASTWGSLAILTLTFLFF